MLDDVPPSLYLALWFVLGAVVGSFLNVAIYRLPREDLSVSRPARSRCPRCEHAIRWYENLPVLSWLALRGRCSSCGGRISIRYPGVELLTAGLFGLAAWRYGAADPALTAVAALVMAGLVVATFVDFDFFEIPDEVSIGGMVLGPLIGVTLPRLHAETPLALRLAGPAGEVDAVAAGLASLAGLAVGGGILLVIGAVGRWVYGKDAMGYGDVKLLAAGGAFVGPAGAVLALMIASVVGSVVGVVNLVVLFLRLRGRARRRGTSRSLGASLRAARAAGAYLPFGPYLGMGVGIVLLAWDHVVTLLP